MMNNNYQPPASFPISQNPHQIPPQDPQSKYPHLPPTFPNQASPFQQQPTNLPPGQNYQGYTMGKANNIGLDPRTQLSYKINQIEKSLDNGCFFCYKLWVWFVILSCCIGVPFSIGEVNKHFAYQSSDRFMLLGLPLILIWVICHNYLIKKAMVEKDVNTAKKAMNSMIIFTVVSITVLFYIINSFTYRRQEAMVSLGLQIGLPVGINVFGAYKVQGALQERDDLSKNLDALSVNVNNANVNSL